MLIFISGMSGSGKTTVAGQLSLLLGGIPVVSLDEIYKRIGNKVRFIRYDKLMDPKFAKCFYDYEEIAARFFSQCLKDLRGRKDVIFEGYSLSFGEDQERIKEILDQRKSVGFNLVVPYDLWVERTMARFGKGERWLADTAAMEYQGLTEGYNPDLNYYQIERPEQILMGKTDYQRVGLTDVKWDQLKMPEAMTGSNILDLGCNSGWIGRYCRDRGAEVVVGLDNNWRYLEDAKAAGYTQTILADLNDDWQKKLPDIRFTRIFCLATMQYVVNKPRFLRQLAELKADEYIIEMPLSGLDVVCEEYFTREISPGHSDEIKVPSRRLMESWLKSAFGSIGVVGQAISPDHSFRLIFKAWRPKA